MSSSAPPVSLRSRPAVVATVVLVAVAGVVFVATRGNADRPDESGSAAAIVLVGPADEGIAGVQAYRIESTGHTEAPVDYGVRPPPGGQHHPVWANCGFHDDAIPDEHVVHDLEHGAVWLAYSPSLPAADLEVLHDLARADDKVIATPYPDLAVGTAVVATAWARQLSLDTVDDPRLERFVVQYQDGSQSPEAGAACDGSPLPVP